MDVVITTIKQQQFLRFKVYFLVYIINTIGRKEWVYACKYGKVDVCPLRTSFPRKKKRYKRATLPGLQWGHVFNLGYTYYMC